MMPEHHYRITVDKLEPTVGEGGLESLSFFASTSHDIFAAIRTLQDRFDCSTCHATKVALGLSLMNEVLGAHRDRTQQPQLAVTGDA